MKNLINKLALCVFALSICSFQLPNPTIQEIFEEAFSMEALQQELMQDQSKKLLPLALVTNGLVEENINLTMDNQPIKIINQLSNLKETEHQILELTDVNKKGKKSILSFQYGEKTIKIRLKRINQEWVVRMFTVKSKNGFQTHIVSVKEEKF